MRMGGWWGVGAPPWANDGATANRVTGDNDLWRAVTVGSGSRTGEADQRPLRGTGRCGRLDDNQLPLASPPTPLLPSAAFTSN